MESITEKTNDEHALAIAIDDETLVLLAGLFKMLSDPTRLKILNALALHEQSVGDISRRMHMSLPAISYHLKYLRILRLIRSRRNGKGVFYSVNKRIVYYLFNIGLDCVKG